jgi:hypothetical protein
MSDCGRDSLEIPRREHDPENQEIEATSERTTADSRSSCFRFLAITVGSCSLYDAWKYIY